MALLKGGEAALEKIIYSNAFFLKSAALSSQFPPDQGLEVAFIGRSNSGKSSAINALTQQKKLAKTSKDPGRTQCINFFVLDEHRRLADLPGYGFAKVPESVKKRWKTLIETYLKKRCSLCGLVLLMDSRHPFLDLDQRMLDFSVQIELPVHILLTKSDKLTRQAAIAVLQQTEQKLKKTGLLCSVQLFSATQKIGVTGLRDKLTIWFHGDDSPEAEQYKD